MNIDELKSLLEEQQCSYCSASDAEVVPCNQELSVICENNCASTLTF